MVKKHKQKNDDVKVSITGVDGQVIKLRQNNMEIDALVESMDDVEERLAEVEDVYITNRGDSVIGTFKLLANQSIASNSRTKVLFSVTDVSASSNNALTRLHLDYSNGVFTNNLNGVNILLVSYQLFYPIDRNGSGYRESAIVHGSYESGRAHFPFYIVIPTYLQGTAVLRLKPNDSFYIATTHTETKATPLSNADNNTRLTITAL